MRVDLRRARGDGSTVLVGSISLDANGNLSPSNDVAASMISDRDLVVVDPDPGAATRLVETSEPERWLRALPATVRSPYLYGVLVD